MEAKSADEPPRRSPPNPVRRSSAAASRTASRTLAQSTGPRGRAVEFRGPSDGRRRTSPSPPMSRLDDRRRIPCAALLPPLHERASRTLAQSPDLVAELLNSAVPVIPRAVARSPSDHQARRPRREELEHLHPGSANSAREPNGFLHGLSKLRASRAEMRQTQAQAAPPGSAAAAFRPDGTGRPVRPPRPVRGGSGAARRNRTAPAPPRPGS